MSAHVTVHTCECWTCAGAIDMSTAMQYIKKSLFGNALMSDKGSHHDCLNALGRLCLGIQQQGLYCPVQVGVRGVPKIGL